MTIFQDEWRKCLQEHYKDVVQRRDERTRTTLQPILGRIGFREDELKELYVRASMHVDDVGADFVPAFDALPAMPSVLTDNEAMTFTPHPAECVCAACMDVVDTTRHDDEGQVLGADAIAEKSERKKQKKKASKG